MSGAHYLVDTIATVPLVVASVALYRWRGEALVFGRRAQSSVAVTAYGVPKLPAAYS
jgi:hypothetical protein